MKEGPILFSGEMVRAILDGRKTQTRRVVKPQPVYGVTECAWSDSGFGITNENGGCLCHGAKSPYGYFGDRLWVRESFTPQYFDDGKPGYKADWTSFATECCPKPKWKPSIHMPRQLSRITLEITNVRVERLQDISTADIQAEGISFDGFVSPAGYEKEGTDLKAAIAYAELWEKINGKKQPWASNPWVWVIEFKKL